MAISRPQQFTLKLQTKKSLEEKLHFIETEINNPVSLLLACKALEEIILTKDYQTKFANNENVATHFNKLYDQAIKQLANERIAKSTALFIAIPDRELNNLADDLTHNKLPNFKATIDDINNVSRYIITDILNSNSYVECIAAIERWIKIANICYKNADFHGHSAICTALQEASVSRLRHEVKQNEDNHFIRPEVAKLLTSNLKLLDQSKSYKNYRNALKNAKNPIPYLGITRTDITFIRDGNKGNKEVISTLTEKTIAPIKKMQAKLKQNAAQNAWDSLHLDEVINFNLSSMSEKTEVKQSGTDFESEKEFYFDTSKHFREMGPSKIIAITVREPLEKGFAALRHDQKTKKELKRRSTMTSLFTTKEKHGDRSSSSIPTSKKKPDNTK